MILFRRLSVTSQNSTYFFWLQRSFIIIVFPTVSQRTLTLFTQKTGRKIFFELLSFVNKFEVASACLCTFGCRFLVHVPIYTNVLVCVYVIRYPQLKISQEYCTNIRQQNLRLLRICTIRVPVITPWLFPKNCNPEFLF